MEEGCPDLTGEQHMPTLICTRASYIFPTFTNFPTYFPTLDKPFHWVLWDLGKQRQSYSLDATVILGHTNVTENGERQWQTP